MPSAHPIGMSATRPTSRRGILFFRLFWLALAALSVGFVVMALQNHQCHVAGATRFIAVPDNLCPDRTSLSFVYVVVAALTAVVAIVVPSLQYRSALQKLEVRREAGPPAILTASKREFDGTLLHGFGGLLVRGMSISMLVALEGWLLTYLGAPKVYAVPFFALCGILQATKFPTLRKILGPLEKLHGATIGIREE